MLFFHNYHKVFVSLAITSINFYEFFKPVFLIQTINYSNITHQKYERHLVAEQKGFSFKGKGRPGRQSSGESRPNCPLPADEKRKLTALMPTSNWGTTTQENPTLWFYVPYSPNQIIYGNFVLQDKNGKNEQRIKFTLPNTPGFVSFKIPKGLELKVGVEQQWFFELYCDQNKSPAYVQGSIEKVEVKNNLRRLLNVPEQNKYKVYAENGIWFDTVNSVANMRRNQSTGKLSEFWQELLASEDIGLSDLPLEPLVGEVLIPNQ